MGGWSNNQGLMAPQQAPAQPQAQQPTPMATAQSNWLQQAFGALLQHLGMGQAQGALGQAGGNPPPAAPASVAPSPLDTGQTALAKAAQAYADRELAKQKAVANPATPMAILAAPAKKGKK